MLRLCVLALAVAPACSFVPAWLASHRSSAALHSTSPLDDVLRNADIVGRRTVAEAGLVSIAAEDARAIVFRPDAARASDHRLRQSSERVIAGEGRRVMVGFDGGLRASDRCGLEVLAWNGGVSDFEIERGMGVCIAGHAVPDADAWAYGMANMVDFDALAAGNILASTHCVDANDPKQVFSVHVTATVEDAEKYVASIDLTKPPYLCGVQAGLIIPPLHFDAFEAE